MFASPLIITGASGSQQASLLSGAGAHRVQPFALRTLRAILADVPAGLMRLAAFIVMPFGATELVPSRHLEPMMALMRRAEEVENTQPDLASELRLMATTYCYI